MTGSLLRRSRELFGIFVFVLGRERRIDRASRGEENGGKQAVKKSEGCTLFDMPLN